MVLRVLAWMWCSLFNVFWYVGIWIYSNSTCNHTWNIVITIGTFHNGNDWTYHTPNRSRAIWHNGQRIELDKNDVGRGMNNIIFALLLKYNGGTYDY